MTMRAVLVGLFGALLLAYLTPWNDWGVRNTMLFGSYLPPVLVVGLLVFAGWINPRLGRLRFERAEIATVLALLLAVGGIASVGLMRHFPAIAVEPVITLTDPAQRARWSRLAEPGELAALEAARRELAVRAITHHDRDGDGRLDASERHGLGLVLGSDTDPLTADDLVQRLLPPLDRLVPPVPDNWTLAEDLADPPQRGSLTWTHRIDDHRLGTGPMNGNQPGTVFTLSGTDGAALALHLADGHRAMQLLAAGHAVADPGSHPQAAALLSTRVGEPVTCFGQEWRLTAISPATAPWSRWWHSLLAWSPTILAMIAGALALAAIVRRQWFVHERLPVPIAGVLHALSDPLTGSEERPPLLRVRGFWLGMSITALVLATRVLDSYGLFSFPFPLELNLFNQVQGVSSVIDAMPNRYDLLTPRLYPTVVALAFLMTLEVSGSLWGAFIIVNVLAGFAAVQGLPIHGSDLDRGTVGAAGVLCLLVVWTGRQWYGRVLLAAVGRNSSPEARAAAPWIWVLLAAVATLAGTLVAAGATIGASVAVALIAFGGMLALARVVAETGTPYVSFGNDGRLGGIILGVVGPVVGPAALMPLLLVGYVIGQGDRERLLPHVLHGLALHDRSGGPDRSNRLLLMIGITCIGAAVLAFMAMITLARFRGGDNADPWPSNMWRWFAIQGAAVLDDPSAAAERASRTWIAYLVGALAVAAVGLARLRWTSWPLHPIGLIVIGGWVTKMCWASYLIGWLVKLAVTRYGGQALYVRLFPVAVGIMAGEALVIVTCTGIGIIRAIGGWDPIAITLLPS